MPDFSEVSLPVSISTSDRRTKLRNNVIRHSFMVFVGRCVVNETVSPPKQRENDVVRWGKSFCRSFGRLETKAWGLLDKHQSVNQQKLSNKQENFRSTQHAASSFALRKCAIRGVKNTLGLHANLHGEETPPGIPISEANVTFTNKTVTRSRCSSGWPIFHFHGFEGKPETHVHTPEIPQEEEWGPRPLRCHPLGSDDARWSIKSKDCHSEWRQRRRQTGSQGN